MTSYVGTSTPLIPACYAYPQDRPRLGFISSCCRLPASPHEVADAARKVSARRRRDLGWGSRQPLPAASQRSRSHAKARRRGRYACAAAAARPVGATGAAARDEAVDAVETLRELATPAKNLAAASPSSVGDLEGALNLIHGLSPHGLKPCLCGATLGVGVDGSEVGVTVISGQGSGLAIYVLSQGRQTGPDVTGHGHRRITITFFTDYTRL